MQESGLLQWSDKCCHALLCLCCSFATFLHFWYRAVYCVFLSSSIAHKRPKSVCIPVNDRIGLELNNEKRCELRGWGRQRSALEG